MLMFIFSLTRWPDLMPHNFSAAYALLFCAGVYFVGWSAWWLPLGIMALTDLGLVLYYADRIESAMSSDVLLGVLPNYLAYLIIIGLGRMFSPRHSWIMLLGGGLLGAILFYLITNTGAWIASPAYAKNLLGWIQSLTLGTPGWPPTWEFFRNTMLSGGLFTGLFVGAMKASEMLESEEEEEDEEGAEDKECEEAPAS